LILKGEPVTKGARQITAILFVALKK
jgi:hypothetical protein